MAENACAFSPLADSPGREHSPRTKPTEDAKSTITPPAHENHTSPATANLPSTDAPGTEVAAPSTENAPSDQAPVDDGDHSDPESAGVPPAESSDQHQQLSTVSTEGVDGCEKNGCGGTDIWCAGWNSCAVAVAHSPGSWKESVRLLQEKAIWQCGLSHQWHVHNT